VYPGIVGFGAVFYTLAVDSFRIGILRSSASSITVRADLLHALSDLSSTLIALAGIALASVGLYIGDVLASLALGIFLVYLSVRLIRAASMDLTDAIPQSSVKKVERELARTEEISGFGDLKMRRVGSKTYVDVAITLPEYVSVEDSHSIASRIESNIGRILGDSSVTVHVEPVRREAPFEVKIKKVSTGLEGVRDVHNVNVHKTVDGFYVTLHIQVDAKASLAEAHRIAERVEDALQKLGVKEATVHIESFEPETSWGRLVHDPEVLTLIDDLVKKHAEIKRVIKTLLYVAEGRLHINISCSFRREISVERLHDIVTTVEEDLRKKFGGATVTIHPEPDLGRD